MKKIFWQITYFGLGGDFVDFGRRPCHFEHGLGAGRFGQTSAARVCVQQVGRGYLSEGRAAAALSEIDMGHLFAHIGQRAYERKGALFLAVAHLLLKLFLVLMHVLEQESIAHLLSLFLVQYVTSNHCV